MNSDSTDSGEQIIVSVDLTISDKQFQAEIPVPARSTRPAKLLPIFRKLEDAFIEAARAESSARGLKTSCTEGCAACCRHLVPLSEVEAYELCDLINAMPDDEQAKILAGFAAGVEKLRQSDLFDKLAELEHLSGEDLRALVWNYFNLWIDCPFLENEACKIYSSRPLSCREHMVISPAKDCSSSFPEKIKHLPLIADAARALRCFNTDQNAYPNRWVPLILVLEWVNSHPGEPAPGNGAELIAKFFNRLVEEEALKKQLARAE